MPARVRIVAVVLAVLLPACVAGRPAVEGAVRPAPAGITPLTVEQDDQISG